MTDMMARRERLRVGGAAMTIMTIMTIMTTITVIIGSACSSGTTTTSADEAAAIPVTVATVAMADMADTFEAGGIVQARTTATIMARILAPVRSVRVAPGDRVRAGQVLIVLDGADLAARARSARAAAQGAAQAAAAAVSAQHAADAGLVLARATHQRIAGLHDKRSATAQELDDATGALRAAEARAAGAAAQAQAAASGVDSALAAGDAADTTASFAVITAPFDGTVTEKMVEPGNMAVPGTPLIRLEDTRGFRLDVRVDESRSGQIALGAIVPVSLDSGPNGETAVSGTVAAISRAVDADARAFLVEITLPELATLRSGMFGRAHLGGQTRRVLTVPAGALVQRGQMTSVFVVERGIARVRLVDVRGTEVLAGLSEGEAVIVVPPPTVTDGRRVSAGGR